MKKGFTLLEMLLTITIIAVLGGVSAPIYMSFLARNDLNVTSTIVVQSLRRAQTQAKNMVNDSDWGIYMTDRVLTIFSGSTYAGRDISYDEDFDIAPTISFSGVTEVVFLRFSGDTSDNGNIILNSNSNETRTITINQRGMVDY